jgi:hypothetical protein
MNHSFDVAMAERYGVNEAIFIENLRFWILKNKANKRHFYDGRYWTYNSAKAFAELFPYWSRQQVERIIHKLKSAGVLLIGHYSQNAYDRTNFYALSDEMDSLFKANPFIENEESTNTDINTDALFTRFWTAYPAKKAKPAALKAFNRLKASDELTSQIIADIEKQKASEQWQKNGGQFIPMPATYLNQRRWEDGICGSAVNEFAGGI